MLYFTGWLQNQPTDQHQASVHWAEGLNPKHTG